MTALAVAKETLQRRESASPRALALAAERQGTAIFLVPEVHTPLSVRRSTLGSAARTVWHCGVDVNNHGSALWKRPAYQSGSTHWQMLHVQSLDTFPPTVGHFGVGPWCTSLMDCRRLFARVMYPSSLTSMRHAARHPRRRRRAAVLQRGHRGAAARGDAGGQGRPEQARATSGHSSTAAPVATVLHVALL